MKLPLEDWIFYYLGIGFWLLVLVLTAIGNLEREWRLLFLLIIVFGVQTLLGLFNIYYQLNKTGGNTNGKSKR